MEHTKTLGLTAVLAVALIAFVGASKASATVLCTEPGTGSPVGTTCPSGEAYPKGTDIHMVLHTGTKAKLETEFKTVECEEATITATTNNEGGPSETVTAVKEAFPIAKCNCEVKVLKTGTLEFHWISGSHNATVTGSETEFTILCSTIFGNVHCIYATANTDVGVLTGGNPATLDTEGSLPRPPTSGLCSSKAHWTAGYEVTNPKPLYVAAHT